MKKFYIPQDIRFHHRIKAFSNEPACVQRILVSPNGEVRVFDDVAGHYTKAHSLSERQEEALRKKASKVAKELKL